MKKFVCLAVLAAAVSAAQAAPVYLDMTSGSYSSTNGGYYDTYIEDGFRLRMVRYGDHMDPRWIGDVGFHNSGQLETSWTLDRFGAAFNMIDINVAGFVNGASSFTLTGSNGASQIISALGTTAVSGMGNITSFTFNINQDGAFQGVGISAINVDTTPAAVPAPGTVGLLGLGLAALGFARRRRAAR